MAVTRILFFPEGERILYEMAPLINRLAETPGVEVHLLRSGEPLRQLPHPNPLSADEISNRVRTHLRPKPAGIGARWIARYEGAVSRVAPRYADWALNFLPSVLLLACLDLVDLFEARRQAKKLVKRIDPEGLVLARDRHVGLSYALLARMRALGRFTCLAPWGFVNTSFLVANRLRDRRNQLHGSQVSIVQRMMRWGGSRHIFPAGGVTYSYFKPGRTLASLASGLFPSNPWYYGSDVDACLVDSDSTADVLESGGVPRYKLRVTGNQIHDVLYLSDDERRVRREQLRRKYGCSKEKVLIVALPHLAEHGLMDWPQHWAEMEYLLGTSQANAAADVLVSLHPRCDRARYEPLAEKMGVRILDEALKTALPVADMFACQWSGTTSWGVSLGLPTLVFDWYGISSMGFEYLENRVIRVGRREDLADSARFLGTAKRASLDFPGLPPIDGCSTQRVCDAILSGLERCRDPQSQPCVGSA